MKGVFVDTSGWATFLLRSQPVHEYGFSLLNTARRERSRIVTSNYVLAELSALLMSPLRVPREVRLTILQRVRTADWVETVHIDSVSDAASWDYLLSRRDKDFKLVDCSSFVIMRTLGLANALTTDMHFEQAGFIRLLK